jgi:hypothetical protein
MQVSLYLNSTVNTGAATQFDAYSLGLVIYILKPDFMTLICSGLPFTTHSTYLMYVFDIANYLEIKFTLRSSEYWSRDCSNNALLCTKYWIFT